MSSENLYESKEILEEYTTLKRKTRVELKKISKLEVAKKCFQALCSRQLSFSDWFPFRGKNTFDRVGVGKKLCLIFRQSNMAYVLRVLRSTLLTLLTSIRPALSEGLDEYSLLNITDQVSNSCILLGLQPADSAALVTILRQLSHTFKGEKLVNIGVLKEEYLSMISWKSGKTLDLAEKNDLAFYRRKKIDRTCLMKPQWKNPPTAERYLGPRTTEKLVEFLNTNCATYRLLDGGLSVAGLRREKILRNLYRVPNSLDTNSINGPINIADKCERISMPSKEKFIEEYYFRSKPVVITGK